MSDLSALQIYFGMTGIFALLFLSLSALLPAKKTNTAKLLPYESGIITTTDLLKKRFPIHHFLVALVFLIFDIEIIFLYPWAVVAKSLEFFGFFEMLFFLSVLLVGYAYVWKKGGLQWE